MRVCVNCAKEFLLFIPALRKDLSIGNPRGTLNMAKVLHDSLLQKIHFPLKKRAVWPMHVNTTICVDGGEGREPGTSPDYGRKRKVERGNREGWASVRESPFISFWRLQRQWASPTALCVDINTLHTHTHTHTHTPNQTSKSTHTVLTHTCLPSHVSSLPLSLCVDESQ